MAYVNQVVPGMIAQEHVQQLQQHVAGLRAVLNDYNQTTDPVQEGEYLTTLISLLDELEPEFFNPRPRSAPWHTLLLSGSIRLVALREQYLFAAQYYGADPDRAAHPHSPAIEHRPLHQGRCRHSQSRDGMETGDGEALSRQHMELWSPQQTTDLPHKHTR